MEPITLENLVVELKPHKGINSIGVEQVHDQDIVYINGRYSGYVGHAEGSHISIIVNGYTPEILAAVKAKIEEIRGGKKTSQVSVVKTVEVVQKMADKANKNATSLSDVGM